MTNWKGQTMRFSRITNKLRQFSRDVRSFKSNNWKSATNAAIYDRATSATGDYQDFLTTEYLNELTSRIAPTTRVLDLGCGTGVLTLALAKSGFQVTGVDISEAMLDRVRQKATGLKVELRTGDVFALPFANEEFDGIVTRWVVPHFKAWPLIIREAARVLQPGGIFVFDMCSTSNYELARGHRELDFDHFGYNPVDEAANGFYASATEHELRLAANVAGIDVISIRPNGMYRNNAIIAAALGVEGHAAFKSRFDEFYQDDKVRSFVQWLDRAVTTKLPLSLTNTLTIVARKAAA